MSKKAIVVLALLLVLAVFISTSLAADNKSPVGYNISGFQRLTYMATRLTAAYWANTSLQYSTCGQHGADLPFRDAHLQSCMKTTSLWALM